MSQPPLHVVHASGETAGSPDGAAEPPPAEAGLRVDSLEAVFFYDLADPDCYLTAERIRAELPVICDWEPVRATALGLAAAAPARPPDAVALAHRVADQGLLPLRLPSRWPIDSALAMRVATYAKGAGKSIAFSLAAFRQTFAGGRDLGEEATVLLAAAACEMHPTAVLKGAELRATTRALASAETRAREAGVGALPAFVLAGLPGVSVTHYGARALEDTLAQLGDADRIASRGR